uniref:LOW QUALITY PROTEIN: sentrin-specific protease 7 n=1 Tax=Solea senegalensis TaxID=28829 RepID=UPI001CD8A7ED|nr:LOW QUALITY PROTEIN: sentrin-specific protease 7 [Solea senegalensis]
MMERRRALTIPFSVNKDNLMENPLKIPMTCLSPECGKLDRQVSWTAFTGCKRQHCDSQHKNGSVLFDHAAMISLEINRRKPRLVLTDVLKTEQGKMHLERIKRSCILEKGGQMSIRKARGQSKKESLICRGTRSGQRDANKDNSKSVTKRNQRSTSSTPQRSRLRRRLHNDDEEEEKEDSQEIQEVIIGKTNGADYKFAEVVVSWEPVESSGGCEEFPPASIKDKWTDPENEVQHSLKRKRKEEESQLNGTVSPKRHRTSVLRLTGEDMGDRGQVPAPICPEDSTEDEYFDNLDRSIVQFTVGGDDTTQVLVPVIHPNLQSGNSAGQESIVRTSSSSEPIVLSSDDEEGSSALQHCSPQIHSLVTVGDTARQEQTSQQALIEPDDSVLQDMEVVRVVVEEHPVPLPPIQSVDDSCMAIAFSNIYCGGYDGKANGDILMGDQNILIPLKDISEQVDVMLTIERKALRRYSVWEEPDMEIRELCLQENKEPSPPAVLLLCVSDTAAATVRRDLCKLRVKQGGTIEIGKASPFILLTLRYPLEGMEGALLRSLLDIDCLNGLTHDHSLSTLDSDRFSCREGIHNPILSLDDSIELIQRTGLDSHLLCLLGLETTDPFLDADQDNSSADEDKKEFSQTDEEENKTPHDLVEVELQKTRQEETVPQLDTAAEQDTETQLKPEEEQKEQEPEQPPEKKKEEPTPVYTLCHCRTKGSYFVSMCKPDSSWTKYKHQGLAHRLIQFPPPPLKGGITVTMEDLQCLDSGQFLNDVIIDFYLKYLLHNVSADVAKRCHIFSSFFYKQLTRRDNASEGGTSESCQRQRRHQRVKTWTRHVDIFKKDFLIVPVNQEAHWYLAVICFPGLDKPRVEAWPGTESDGRIQSVDQDETQISKSPDHSAETPPILNHSDTAATETEKTKDEVTKAPPPGPVKCTQKTYQKNTVCKRPCILIMDSLKISLHERVFKLLREYLQSEWEVRQCSTREFGHDQMKSSHCQVPLQDNSSDCGLYLLQYVESFLKDPVVHFDLPLQLQRWFPRQQVRRKRDEIRDLVLYLYRQQNLDKRR